MRSPHPKLPNGVWGQIRTLLFHPETFFKALSTGASAWLFMAVVLMLLTGVSEVQRQQRLNEAPNDGATMDMGMPLIMDEGMSMGDPMMPGGGVPLPPSEVGGGSAAPTGVPITQQLEQILGATGAILGMWLVLTPLLAIVPFFNRTAPRWSRALQVAIWAAVPLGVMAVLQLAYYSAGGKAGEPGLVGIVDELPFYASLSAVQKSLVLSTASKVTLFHIWTLALIYLGARHTLRGKRVVVSIVMVAWLMLMVFLPVATGAYRIEEELPPIQTLPEDPMFGEGEMSGEGGEIPAEMTEKGEWLVPEGVDPTGEELPVEEAEPVRSIKPSGGKPR